MTLDGKWISCLIVQQQCRCHFVCPCFFFSCFWFIKPCSFLVLDLEEWRRKSLLTLCLNDSLHSFHWCSSVNAPTECCVLHLPHNNQMSRSKMKGIQILNSKRNITLKQGWSDTTFLRKEKRASTCTLQNYFDYVFVQHSSAYFSKTWSGCLRFHYSSSSILTQLPYTKIYYWYW